MATSDRPEDPEPLRVTCSEIGHNSTDYKVATDLRLRVLRYPLGLDFSDAELNSEASCRHLVAKVEGKGILACLVLDPPNSDGSIKMRQVAVEPGFQGCGLGRILVKFSEEVASASGLKMMVLHARDTAVPFYLRLGYEKLSEPFVEVGLRHWKMCKELG